MAKALVDSHGNSPPPALAGLCAQAHYVVMHKAPQPPSEATPSGPQSYNGKTLKNAEWKVKQLEKKKEWLQNKVQEAKDALQMAEDNLQAGQVALDEANGKVRHIKANLQPGQVDAAAAASMPPQYVANDKPDLDLLSSLMLL